MLWSKSIFNQIKFCVDILLILLFFLNFIFVWSLNLFWTFVLIHLIFATLTVLSAFGIIKSLWDFGLLQFFWNSLRLFILKGDLSASCWYFKFLNCDLLVEGLTSFFILSEKESTPIFQNLDLFIFLTSIVFTLSGSFPSIFINNTTGLTLFNNIFRTERRRFYFNLYFLIPCSIYFLLYSVLIFKWITISLSYLKSTIACNLLGSSIILTLIIKIKHLQMINIALWRL